MSKLLVSLRIWQKALLPLALSVAIACGLVAFLNSVTDRAERDLRGALDGESAAALHTARMNITLVDLSRITWKLIADVSGDGHAQKREIEVLDQQFRERLQKVRDALRASGMRAKLTKIGRAHV